MTKLRKDLKKILLVVFGAMLLFNAGYDLTRWLSRRSVEKTVTAEVKKNEQISDARVVQCYNVADIGWLCDLELTTIEGRHGRMLQVFTYEDLASE